MADVDPAIETRRRELKERRPEISAIVTCYFEEKSIDEFYSRLSKALDSTGRDYEIVFVNDGSTDGTFERLRAIHRRDPRVTALDLFRNVGQGAAITAGLSKARGKNYFFMDSDLQLDPEEIPRLLAEFDQGYDVVGGRRRKRQDSWDRRLASRLANVIMRRVSRSDFTDLGCTFRFVRGPLVDALKTNPQWVFNAPYVIREGSRFKEVEVNHHPRPHGESGWTFWELFQVNMDNLVGTADRFFQGISIVSFLVALVVLLRILISWIFPRTVLSEVTPGLLLNAELLATAFLAGILSLLGEFVIRTHNMALRSPVFVIRELLD